MRLASPLVILLRRRRYLHARLRRLWRRHDRRWRLRLRLRCLHCRLRRLWLRCATGRAGGGGGGSCGAACGCGVGSTTSAVIAAHGLRSGAGGCCEDAAHELSAAADRLCQLSHAPHLLPHVLS